jgi:hypothetical protein
VFDRHRPRELLLREAGRRRRLWDKDVVFDADGHMYLAHGWKQFARADDLQLGHVRILSYDSSRTMLTVKVFDRSMCRRHYQHDELCYSSLDFNVQLFHRCEGLVFDELRPCVRG